MKKTTLIALSAVMVASLGAFAVGQSNASKPGSHDAAIAALETKEARVVSQLKLTPKQKVSYDALQKKLRAETASMNAMSSGRIEKGIEINEMLHSGLKKILTSTQYLEYRRLWAGQGSADAGYARPGKPSAPKMGQARVVQEGGHSLPVSDDDVLRRVGATQVQIDKVHNLYLEMESGREELHALWQTGDDDAIWKKSMDLNKQFNAGVQKILTPAQYKEYKRIWEEAMAPALARGRGVKVSFVKPSQPPPAAKGG